MSASAKGSGGMFVVRRRDLTHHVHPDHAVIGIAVDPVGPPLLPPDFRPTSAASRTWPPALSAA